MVDCKLNFAFFNGENDENSNHIDLKETINQIEVAEKMETKDIYELLLERKKAQEVEKELEKNE